MIAKYGTDPLPEGRLYLGLVEGAAEGGAYRVRVGAHVYKLPAANMLWAVPYSAKDTVNDRKLVSRDWIFYLENRLREAAELEGCPVIIDLVER